MPVLLSRVVRICVVQDAPHNSTLAVYRRQVAGVGALERIVTPGGCPYGPLAGVSPAFAPRRDVLRCYPGLCRGAVRTAGATWNGLCTPASASGWLDASKLQWPASAASRLLQHGVQA